MYEPKPHHMYEPKPHQLECIEAGIIHYTNNDLGKMTMPCGSGKTLSAFWLAKKLHAKRIIVVLPMIQLQAQALKDWITIVDHSTKILVVGSGTSGIKATTDEHVILRELQQSDDIIVFTTYNSSTLLANVAYENDIIFDICIFDEAHHTAGDDKVDFQSLLKIPVMIKKKLFMTATPRVMIPNENFPQYFSMDNEEIYGKEFYRLSVRQAIRDKIISDYKVVVMYLRNDELANLVNENKWVINDDVEGESRMISIAVCTVKAIKKHNLKKIIAFTSSIARSDEFREIFKVVSASMGLNIDVLHIDHTYSEKQRNETLDNFFSSNCSLITNTNMLGEGVDIPSVDATVFVDEKSSIGAIVQAAGRAWRYQETKPYGYILLPTFINARGLNNDYKILRNVLSALSTTDEAIYSYFKTFIHTGRINDSSLIEGMNDIAITVPLNTFMEGLSLSVWRNVEGMDSNSRYVPWEEAAAFTTSLSKYGIDTVAKWLQYCDDESTFPGAPVKPLNIPRNLYVYKNYEAKLFFTGIRGEWVSMEEAAAFTMSLGKYGIVNSKQFAIYVRNPEKFPGAPPLPLNIPKHLPEVYKEYKPYLFFTEGARNEWISMEEAAVFVRSLEPYGITNRKQYEVYCNHPQKFPNAPIRPTDVPKYLHIAYKEDYKPELFFPGQRHYRMVSSEECAKFTLSLGQFGIVNSTLYTKYWKNQKLFPGAPPFPPNIPKAPWNTYDDYKSENFFSNPTKKGGWRDKEEAKKFTLSLSQYGVYDYTNYRKYCINPALFPGAPPLPKDMPRALKSVYEDFKIEEFFTKVKLTARDTARVMPVEEAIAFISVLANFGIDRMIRYQEYCSNPENFPGAPAKPWNMPRDLKNVYKGVYKKELFFKSPGKYTGDYNWASAEEAAKFVSGLATYGINTIKDYQEYRKGDKKFSQAPQCPDNIPVGLSGVYGKNFKYSKFFPNSGRRKITADAQKVIKYVHSLRQYGITNPFHWKAFVKGKFPGISLADDMPRDLVSYFGKNYDRERLFPNWKQPVSKITIDSVYNFYKENEVEFKKIVFDNPKVFSGEVRRSMIVKMHAGAKELVSKYCERFGYAKKDYKHLLTIYHCSDLVDSKKLVYGRNLRCSGQSH